MKTRFLNKNNKTLIDKNNPLQIAITSIFENRIPVFLPVKQTTHLKLKKELDEKGFVVFETSYGLLEIRGTLLTQTHKNLLEAILSYEKYLVEDDSYYVKFKPYDLLKNRLGKKHPNDYSHLNKLLKELASFSMVLKVTKDIEIGFRFIDDFLIDNRVSGNRKENFYFVKFTRVLSAIWKNETLYNYSKILPVFDKITIPIVQAITKFLLTYDKYEIKVEKLLDIFNLRKIFSTEKSRQKILSDVRKSFSNPEILFFYKHFGIYYIEKEDKIGINKSEILLTEDLLLEIKREKSFTSKMEEKHKIEQQKAFKAEQLSLF